MKTTIERYRELAGIVESRPAYMGTLSEQTETQEMLEARIGDLTERELYSEIEGLITEREGLFELLAEDKHHLRMKVTPGQDAKVHADYAKDASRVAKSPTLPKKLSSLRHPKRPDAAWMEKHSGLQKGDTQAKPRSDTARGEASRRLHAIAAFHHFHAAQAHKKLGNTRKAELHGKAAEAHHKKAKAPEGSDGGSYMLHPKTGVHVDAWTPVYDKKSEKAAKNKISRQARQAAAKERKVWKAKEAA